MIKITIHGTDKLLADAKKLADAKAKLPDKITQAGYEFGLKAIRISKENYLSGPRPEKLGVVTGRLRSSLQLKVVKVGDKDVQVNIGTNVVYARIHEYGGTINMKPRVSKLFIKEYKSGPRAGKKLFSKEGKASYGMKVNSKAYKIDIPKRPYLYPAVMDALPDLRKDLLSILGGVIRE